MSSGSDWCTCNTLACNYDYKLQCLLLLSITLWANTSYVLGGEYRSVYYLIFNNVFNILGGRRRTEKKRRFPVNGSSLSRPVEGAHLKRWSESMQCRLLQKFEPFLYWSTEDKKDTRHIQIPCSRYLMLYYRCLTLIPCKNNRTITHLS